PEERAVLLHGQLRAMNLLAGLIARAQVLLAILHPRDWPADANRRERDQVVLGGELATGTGGSADMQLDHAHPALVRPTQQAQQNRLVDVRDLGRAPYGHGLGLR